jgi:phosphoribosylformylglycinamidine synthase
MSEISNNTDLNKIQEPLNLEEVINLLILHPDLTSKNWVFEQLNPVDSKNMASDAGIVEIESTEKAMAISTAGNTKFLEASAFEGSMIAVAEAVRKVVCSGGRPTGISADLNFGNAQDNGVSEAFTDAISGIKLAAEKLKAKVTGNDLVFDQRQSISSSAVTIAAMGILDNKRTQTTLPFKSKGDLIFMVGKGQNDISSSDYLSAFHGVQKAPAPFLNLDYEFATHQTIRNLIASGIVQSCHSITNGGLFMCLFEKCLHNELGFDITLPIEFRRDAFLFGESQSRAVITVKEDDHELLLELMDKESAPLLMLGHVTKSEMRIDNEGYGYIDEIMPEYTNALSKTLKK